MKYTGLFIRTFFTLALLLLSHTSAALELLDAKLPISLKKAYDSRYNDPLSCIETINQYMQKRASAADVDEETQHNHPARVSNALPTHLQALCYAQLENYSKALNLLEPLLKKPSVSAEQITTLNLIALEIPEEERPQLSNRLLLEMLIDAAQGIQQQPSAKLPNMAGILQLTITELCLQTNRYHDAYNALEEAQRVIKQNKNKHLDVWLAYYYGLYYDKINQPQLAISYYQLADNMPASIKLRGQIKKGISDIYQRKHRFQIALNFAGQQVELYQSSANKIKQASSLIDYAILKRKNNEYNQSLIYLFNALELIQNNKQEILLARVYLELGRSYLLSNDKEERNLELAQKYLQNARFHFSRLNKPRYQIESLLLLAKLNITNNDPALAILQLEKVLQLSKNRYLSLRLQAFEMLALSNEMTNNHQQAIENFKNVNALQKRIKEQQFELQQLQISEQLKLFEKTQQQKQLEIKNTQLEETTLFYQRISYGSLSLLILVTALFFHALKRNKKLNDANQTALQRLAIHPRTKLPFQHADSNHFRYMYHGFPLYYALLNIPFLSQLNELLGTYGAMKIEKKLGEELTLYFNDNADIFQFRGNQILFIAKQNDYKNAGDFAQKIENFFAAFCEKNQLRNAVSCGIVAFPFLKKAGRAFSPSRTLNLSSLALFAASQIRKQQHQSSWVELYAIDNLQPAFFNGDLWRLGQMAIDKGLVKINTSHPGFRFNWPEQDK
ncbi:MAG: GGDEF domain-containing protein [Psychromonas sp.]|nr:GGDEF domain-containing protein [Psychromonas sp.]